MVYFDNISYNHLYWSNFSLDFNLKCRMKDI